MKTHVTRLLLVVLSILMMCSTVALPAMADSASVMEYESNVQANGNDIFYGPYGRAQTFTPGETHTVTTVSLPLIKTGNPAGNVEVSIKATDSAGRPAGNDLAAGSMAASSVTSSWSPAQWYAIDLGEGCLVEAGKTYAMVWRAPRATSSSAMYYWVNLGGSYSGGQLMGGDGGSGWITLGSWDGAFRESGYAQVNPAPTPTPTPTPAPTPAPITEDINIGDAYALFLQGVTFIDIRSPEELADGGSSGEAARGYIPGMINIDFSAPDFEEQLDQLDKDAVYVEYCRTGNRTTQAKPVFEALGFREVYNMLGGMVEWKAAGYPVEYLPAPAPVPSPTPTPAPAPTPPPGGG